MTLLDSPLFSTFSIHNFNNNNADNSYSPTQLNVRACLACRMAHKSCDRGKPCTRCISRGIAHLCCEPSTKKRGRPRKWKDSDNEYTTTNSTNSTDSPQSTPISPEQPVLEVASSTSSPSIVLSPVTQHTSVNFDSSTLYNEIPSTIATTTTIGSTCKSPNEEALLTETLKKTQSKKLKFIKIMKYNPNHRETFSPRFTITSSEKNLEGPKHALESSFTPSNPAVNMSTEPSLKKRKTKSSTATIVSTPTTNFAMSYQTSTVQQPTTQPFTTQQSYPPVQPIQATNPVLYHQQVNNSYSQMPTLQSPPQSYYPALDNTCYFPSQQFSYPPYNQPRHCDEGSYVNNHIVKLPSIHNLLSFLQE